MINKDLSLMITMRTLEQFLNDLTDKKSNDKEINSLKELEKVIEETKPIQEEVYMISFTTPN